MYNVYTLDVCGQKDEPMKAQRCGKEAARTETDNRMVGNPADNAGSRCGGAEPLFASRLADTLLVRSGYRERTSSARSALGTGEVCFPDRPGCTVWYRDDSGDLVIGHRKASDCGLPMRVGGEPASCPAFPGL